MTLGAHLCVRPPAVRSIAKCKPEQEKSHLYLLVEDRFRIKMKYFLMI
jgi:hypothetical protein